MFANQFVSPARNFLEQASFSASKLGSPIGNSTEISPILRQRGNNPPNGAPRLDQNNDNPMSVSGRRLAAPVGLSTSTSSRSSRTVLCDWFYGIMHMRRNYAIAGSIFASSLIFTAFNLLLKLSIWSPLTSFTEAVFSFFTLTWIFQLLFYSVFVGFVCFVWSFLMLKVDGNNQLSKYQLSNWMFFFIVASMELLANVVLWCSCLSAVASPDSAASAYVFNLLIVLKISYDAVFSSTFRLTQPLIEVNVRSDILSMLELRSESMYREAAIGALLAFKRAVWIYVPLTVFFPLSLWNLLIGFFVAYRLNRILLTQNIEFTMPLTYALKEPSDEDKRNIVHGLHSDDLPVQVFAFWDLKKLSFGDSLRRLDIYSLSQPGGHPRNWNAVKDACLKAVNSVTKKIEEENNYLRIRDIQELAEHVILDSNAVKDGNIEVDRSAMMLPPELRLHMHRENIRLRREYAISGRRFNAIRKIPFVAKIEKLITSVVNYFAEKKKVVTDFEADQANCAIESLRALVQHSYDEDRYGVVQKDLDQVFSCFLGLLNSTESNIRIKHLKSANAPVPEQVRHFNAGVLKLEQTVTVAINRLATTFKDHIQVLHLSEQEKEVLKTLIQ
ncbi:hypothetical protein QR680_005852 [Steinernema hermaphroditum]|uniref:Nucleoporin NDC1 n=1 Tax=Steinernema hermaphroditum TaxID=289476 RepID=A0AA39LVL4_9BILA|nr:hypothetical protein QR680_005852 [Steinernema hermaphroditum]